MGWDVDRYLRNTRVIHNENGSRGYDRGVRVFDCPLCGDKRGRGWARLTAFSAVFGCFNSGCVAEERVGLIEWVQRLCGFEAKAQAVIALDPYQMHGSSIALPAKAPQVTKDWCTLPAAFRQFPGSESGVRYRAFLNKQWGLQPCDAEHGKWGYVASGTRYADCILMPIFMQHVLVAFQARRLFPKPRQPKYVSSAAGKECARDMGSVLWGLDDVRTGETVVLTEGIADALRYNRDRTRGRAVALCGQALTASRAALLLLAAPGRVIVALDAEPAAQRRAEKHATVLRAWGFDATVGIWVGGKDAGSGARLEERWYSVEDRIGGRWTNLLM